MIVRPISPLFASHQKWRFRLAPPVSRPEILGQFRYRRSLEREEHRRQILLSRTALPAVIVAEKMVSRP